MAELSPAARAVLTAFDQEIRCDRLALAAALRTAAVYSYCPVDRRILMAIADELEGQNHLTEGNDQ